MPKAKKSEKKVVEKVGKGKPFSIEILVNDSVYKDKGASIEGLLGGFVSSPEFPVAVKTRAVIRCSNGKADYQWVLPTFLARRMFKMISKKPSALELMASRLIGNLE